MPARCKCYVNIRLLLGLWQEQSPWVSTGQFLGMLLIWSWWNLQVCQLQICRANSGAQAWPSVPNCPLALFVLGWLLTCFYDLGIFWSILYSLRFLFVYLFLSFKITFKITFIWCACVCVHTHACICACVCECLCVCHACLLGLEDNLWEFILFLRVGTE